MDKSQDKKKIQQKVTETKAKQSRLTSMFTPKVSQDAKSENTAGKDEQTANGDKTDGGVIIERGATLTGTAPKQRYVKLPRSFFQAEVVELSRNLLGKVIRRTVNGKTLRVRIVETEAYKAPEDKACHAYNNKKTERTKAFWCDAGCWYVYSIYMKTNICLNIVAVDKNTPEATLIRAGEPLENIGEMQINRNMVGKNTPAQIANLTNGPGKLGMALGMTLEHSTHDFCADDYEEAVIEEDLEYTLKDEDIGSSARINIDYAQEYKDKPWRFFIKGNKYVSKP